jgi:hypothetical protein
MKKKVVNILFKKRYAFLVLLSLLVCMLAVSSVSAAEDAISEDVGAEAVTVDEVVADVSVSDNVLESENEDTIVNDVAEDTSDDTLAVEDEVTTPQEAVDVSADEVDISDETLAIEEKVTADKNVLSSSGDEEIVSQANTEEVLGSPDSYDYSVDINSLNVEYGKKIVVPIHVTPTDDNDYDFYFRIYGGDGYYIVSQNLWNYDAEGPLDIPYNVSSLSPGVYKMEITNYGDGDVMDTATLTVYRNVKITVSQTGYYYNNKKITVKVVDKNTNAAVGSCSVALKFSNGKTVYVTTNSKGIGTYNVPFNPGTYKVTASPRYKSYKATSVTATVKILKHRGIISIRQTGRFYKDKKITVKAYDSSLRTPIKGKYIKLRFSNGKTVSVKTNSKGIATYNVNFRPGRYRVVATAAIKNYAIPSRKLTNVRINKIPIKIVVRTLKTTYDSGVTINIKAVNRATNKPVKGVVLNVRVQGKGGARVKTGDCGKVSLDYSDSSIGRHKVGISIASRQFHSGRSKISYLIIKQAKMSVYAPETINVYRQSDNYTVIVYNNYSLRVVKNAKVTMKVFTGRKYKTFTARTDEYGLARFNTKSLRKGKHKVAVYVQANRYYRATRGQGLLEISTKIPTAIGYYDYIHRYGTTFTTYMYGVPSSSTFYCTSIGVDVVLYDKNGNALSKEVKVTHSNGNVAYGTSGGDRIYVDGTDSGTITLSFAGDSKYLPSSNTYTL